MRIPIRLARLGVVEAHTLPEILDSKQIEDLPLGLGRYGPDVLVGPGEMDSRVGVDLVEDALGIPVAPVLRLDGAHLAAQLGQHDQGDEVHEQPAFHRGLAMDVEPVAVKQVLHVVEVELDVASLVVMLQGLGGVLLGIGEDHPEPAVSLDEGVDRILPQKNLAASLGGILHLEVSLVQALVLLQGLVTDKLLFTRAKLEHQGGDILLLLDGVEVDMAPGPAVLLGLVVGDTVDVGIVVIRVAYDVGRPADRVPDGVDELLLPFQVRGDRNGELLALADDVPQVAVAVEASIADQGDRLDAELVQALQDMAEDDRIRQASRKLAVPQRHIGGMGAEKAEVDLLKVLMVAVVAPLHVTVVPGVARDAGDVEQDRAFPRLFRDPELEERVAPVIRQRPQQFRNPLRAERAAIEAAVVKPVLGPAERPSLADAESRELKNLVRVSFAKSLLQHGPQGAVPHDLVQKQVLPHERRRGDEGGWIRGAGGGFPPGMVVLVVGGGAVRVEAADTFPLVLAPLLVAVPEGRVLIQVGHAVLLVGHFNDLRFGNAVVLHRYNYIYDLVVCQAESQHISICLQ